MTSGLLSDARWTGPHGIGRFAAEVLRRLPPHRRLEHGPKPLSVADPLWLLWQVTRKRPAVFFSPGFNPPPVCRLPFVFTIHDLIQIRLADVATPAKRLYYEAIVKPACWRAFRVLTVSEYSRSEILAWSRLPEDRVVNVGNGVGEPFTARGPRYEPGFPYILYVGNFRPHKNLDRLFEAFARLRRSGLRLLLTGSPDEAIKARLERLCLWQCTVFLPGLSDIALARVYRGASLVVLPSLMEGFGLPALEAMACGTPVIVSREAALPEVVGAAGICVDPRDVASMHEALERVLSDAGRRAVMRESGIRRACLFSWESVAARVGGILQEAAH